MSHVSDEINAYLAGALTDDERTAVETHLADCELCRAELTATAEADAAMRLLFADLHPSEEFEERMIETLRRRRGIHPMIRKVAAGVAAVALLGGIGYAGEGMIDHGGNFAWGWRSNSPPALARYVKLSSSMDNGPAGAPAAAAPAPPPPPPWLVATVAPRPPNESEARDKSATAWGALPTTEPAGSAVQSAPATDVLRDAEKTNASAAYFDALDARGSKAEAKENSRAAADDNRIQQRAADADGVKDQPAPRQPPPPAEPTAGDKPATPPAAQPDQTSPPAVETPPVQRVDAAVKPMIIRTGDMEFEVDSFDSTVSTIGKIVAEEQGYISTTNSDKLPNGKVRGSIVLRVPAEHLDTVVLKLRGIGDLHTQHISAQDITKQFTDTQSALRAARAMQERLLDIIKNGKGAVKDLLEAEKQLAVWREKVEQLEGEIRYYSNQVALSTLTLSLTERDIRMPAQASETETVTMALESDDVEDAYLKVKEAVQQAKGRILSSELKQYDAGQFGATLSVQTPPDAADGVIGRIKQLPGRVARYERQRAQTTSNGSSPVDQRMNVEALKVKREDVTINLTLYNLANVAPRRTTALTLVAPDVEQAYRALIEQARAAGGRVVTSQLNRVKSDEVAGSITFNAPTEKADMLLAAIRGFGEVLKSETVENPQTQNVTESKRGFVVTIGSLSAFGARQSQQISLAAANVPTAFNDLLNLLHGQSGRILTSLLNEQDRGNTSATLEFEAPREVVAQIDQTYAKDGEVVSRVVNRATDTENTVDSKVRVSLKIVQAEQLPPRQTTELSVEVADVQKAMDDLQAAALAWGGRQVDNPQISQGDGGQTTATLTLDLPLDRAQQLIDSADAMGARKSRRTAVDAHAPQGKLARARVTATFSTPATLASSDEGIWAGIRRGLGTSLRGLSYSLTLLIIGLCLVAPWVVLIAAGWRVIKWSRQSRATAARASAPTP